MECARRLFDEGEAFVAFHRAGMFSRGDNKSHFLT
jgi:hypothetical protein